MREQQEKAYAKLNLSLDVTARREDGFHELAMLMQTVSVCDELTLSLNETGAVLWKTLEKGATKEQLVKALLAEYDVDEATAEKDVSAFIEKLQEAKLVK